jgi:hypothetical protein
MTIEQLAITVIKACEKNNVDHMLTDAFAFNYYGVPRATKDVDIVVEVTGSKGIKDLIMDLEPEIHFNGQVQFDTLTWVGGISERLLQTQPFKLNSSNYLMIISSKVSFTEKSG